MIVKVVRQTEGVFILIQDFNQWESLFLKGENRCLHMLLVKILSSLVSVHKRVKIVNEEKGSCFIYKEKVKNIYIKWRRLICNLIVSEQFSKGICFCVTIL